MKSQAAPKANMMMGSTSSKRGGVTNKSTLTTTKQVKKPLRIKISLSPTHIEELRQAFDIFDTEGTGRIQGSEVKIALRALGYEVKREELRNLLAEVGSTPNGTIDFSDFLAVLTNKICERESCEEVRRAFKHFDEDDKGYISFKDLRGVSHMLNHGLTDDELKEMMVFASNERQGPRDLYFDAVDIPNINEEDFIKLMRKANVF